MQSSAQVLEFRYVIAEIPFSQASVVQESMLYYNLRSWAGIDHRDSPGRTPCLQLQDNLSILLCKICFSNCSPDEMVEILGDPWLLKVYTQNPLSRLRSSLPARLKHPKETLLNRFLCLTTSIIQSKSSIALNSYCLRQIRWQSLCYAQEL